MTQEELKAALRYVKSTGKFYWRVDRSPTARKGQLAGGVNSQGYHMIMLDGKTYGAHRLAVLYVTGILPSVQVDHRNGVRYDNRWVNLREAGQSINSQNRRAANRNSLTGLLGVTYQPGSSKHKPFAARIRVGDRHHFLGRFPTGQQAHRAYLKAKRSLHAGCTI